jgi:hypothetical protein
VLRSLAFALLKHDGKNPAKEDLEPDRPGRKNLERVRKEVPPRRSSDGVAPGVTVELVKALRTATADEMGAEAGALTNRGVLPRFVWDGLFLGAGELLMRQPGIVGLHTLTTLNALHYAARTTGDAELRKFLLLQGASFLPMFREAMTSRGKVGDAKVDELRPRDERKEYLVKDVYGELSRDREAAARTAFQLLQSDPAAAKELTDEARRLIFLKGNDSHDYKFSSAVLEDAAHVSPAWRSHFLAASLFWLKGSDAPDSPLVKRTRAALQ